MGLGVTGQLYVSLAVYCQITGTKPDTARWRLRAGRLRGRKTKAGWRVLSSELAKKKGV